jgi:hypothetical protein
MGCAGVLHCALAVGFAVTASFGCGEATRTDTGKHIDVGGDQDASVVDIDAAVPGLVEAGHRMDARTTMLGHRADADAHGGMDVHVDARSVEDAAARADAQSSDAAPDALADAAERVCVPAPSLPPTSATCSDLPYSAAPETYVLWIADAAAPGGGYAVTIPLGGTVNAGGHEYKDGFGLFGGGQHGVFGDAFFDVDGVAKALSFHLEGCAVPLGTDAWELDAAVTRSGASCSSCPESIARRYWIRRSGTGPNARYTFHAVGPVQPCELGADLLDFVLRA